LYVTLDSSRSANGKTLKKRIVHPDFQVVVLFLAEVANMASFSVSNEVEKFIERFYEYYNKNRNFEEHML
jgi:hypothetical protein